MIDVAEQWLMIECDFQSVYGIDLGGHVRTADGWAPILRVRTARWLMWRIHGLSSEPQSRFHAIIRDANKQPESKPDGLTDEDEVIV